MSRLLVFHRWLGLVACVGILMWGLSGVLHPIMSRLQPRPAVAMAPAQVVSLKNAIPVAEALKRQRIEEITTLRVIAWEEKIYYQISLPGQPQRLYIDVHNGNVMQDGDRRYAEFLARYFLQDSNSRITSIDLIQHFTDEYNAVNRLLPVYRVALERADNVRIYVDTAESRIGTLVDNTKAWMAPLFSTLHTWRFFNDYPRMQVIVMSVFLLAAFVTAVLGIVLYIVLWKTVKQRLKANRLRHIHRVLGIVIATTTLTFTFSGTYHLWKSFERDRERYPIHEQRINVTDITGIAMPSDSYARIAMVLLNEVAYFQVAPTAPTFIGGEHDHHKKEVKPDALHLLNYQYANTSVKLENGAEHHARQLAGFYSGLPDDNITSVKFISRFEDEYGFIFKRLPVYRVDYDTSDHVRYYVELSTGALAARIDDDDAFEGKTFAYLHKWHVTEKGKDVRDSLLALFAFANVIVALLGLILFLRQQQVFARACHRRNR